MNAELQLNRPEPSALLESERVKITAPDVFRFLQQYWPLICGIFLSTVITTYLTVSFLTDRYQITAKLLVRLGREQIQPPPTVNSGGNLFSMGLRKEDVASEIQVLQSPDLVAQIVDAVGVENFKQKPILPASFLGRIKFYLKQSVRKLRELGNETLIVFGLKKRLDDREQAIAWLLQSISIVPEKESDVISVQLSTPDPEVGVQILRTWIDLYLRRRLQMRQNTGVQEFLEAGVKESREQLEQVETQKRQWKQTHLLSESKEQVALMLRRLSDLSAEQSHTLREAGTLNREIKSAKALIAASQRNLPTKREESPNHILTKLREELANLQMERSKLLNKFQGPSEPVQNVEEQIARVAQLIKKENATQVFVTYELNPLVGSLEQRLSERSIQFEGLRGKTEAQKQQRDKLEEELQTLADADAKLAEIERERQIAEHQYLEIVKRKQEADVTAALDLQRISNVSVLTPPVSSIEPVSPRRLMMVGLSAVLGLLLGCGLSLLLAYVDDRVGQPTQLAELTDLPYLGTISSERELTVTSFTHDHSTANT